MLTLHDIGLLVVGAGLGTLLFAAISFIWARRFCLRNGESTRKLDQ